MGSTKKPTLYIVMPCFNEAKVIPHTFPQVQKALTTLTQQNIISITSRMLFVDDGSTDSTWQTIESIAAKNPIVSGIKLATNSGHQLALLAGMEVAKDYADIVITMDVDLQDDLAIIKDMIKAYSDGADAVLGVHNDRQKDSLAKRLEARVYYGLMNRLGSKTIPNHADFRLLNSKAIEKIIQHKFYNLHLRGIIPNLGLNISTVYYKRKARGYGKAPYTISKRLTLAMDGITQSSIRPLQIVFATGAFFCIISVISTLLFISLPIIFGGAPKWLGLVACLLVFLTGIQLLAIWLVGEYAGRAYAIAKHGPLYTVQQTIGIKHAQKNP